MDAKTKADLLEEACNTFFQKLDENAYRSDTSAEQDLIDALGTTLLPFIEENRKLVDKLHLQRLELRRWRNAAMQDAKHLESTLSTLERMNTMLKALNNKY